MTPFGTLAFFINCPSACLSDVFRTAAMKPPFQGQYGRRCQFLAKAGEWFVPGLCPSPDIVQPVYQWPSCHTQPHLPCHPSWNFLRDRVHSDSRSCTSCQILWRLKPSTSKTVTSAFHVHNNRSLHELNVHINGQRLKHDPYPVYLGVSLDQTLSYRGASKLKSRNNLIAKLATTSWSASASILCTSALALCYSVTEYCCPVWARSNYTNLINTQLHSAMCLISGCLQPTQLSRLSDSQVSISLFICGLRWHISRQLKAHVTRSLSCDCGQQQTMNHIVNM